jgi:hypothetical protein
MPQGQRWQGASLGEEFLFRGEVKRRAVDRVQMVARPRKAAKVSGTPNSLIATRPSVGARTLRASLCWLLETSVRKIGLLCLMKEASCQSMCSASTINAVHFAPVF